MGEAQTLADLKEGVRGLGRVEAKLQKGIVSWLHEQRDGGAVEPPFRNLVLHPLPTIQTILQFMKCFYALTWINLHVNFTKERGTLGTVFDKALLI